MRKFPLIQAASMVVFSMLLTCCNNVLIHINSIHSKKINVFSENKLDSLRQFLNKSGASSMLILIDGKVIFEWGDTSEKHIIHSIRKPLIHSLIGIAVNQQKIDTSMTMKSLGMQDIAPKLSELELSARVADLLKSRSGIYHLSSAMTKRMKNNLPARNSHQLGEFYYYNNWDFNALGTILEKQTGQTIFVLFLHQIAIPLGMKDYKGLYKDVDGDSKQNPQISEVDGYYKHQKSQSKYPAYHFRISTRDLALLGQLYLNNGVWNGTQIVPKEWIEISKKPYSIINEKKGIAYGMLWKLNLDKTNKKAVSFYHTGLEMQLLGVYPELNMVIVHRVNTEKSYQYNKEDLEKTLKIVFDTKI